MLTIADHVKEVRAVFPKCGPNEAQALVWKAIQDLCNEHSWSFLLKEGKLITEASYSTGTLSVVNGSANVALSADGTWSTAWTTTPSTRKIVIVGRPESYLLTITGANTGVLDSTFLGDTNTAAAYYLFRDTYTLPVDCDFGREYIVLDPARNRVLDIRDYGRLHQQISMLQNAPGIPDAIARVGLTTAFGVVGVPQVKFGPYPPSSQEVYVLLYFQAPTKPSQLTDYPAPLWPRRAEDLIHKRAIWRFAEDHDLPNVMRKKDDYLTRFFDVQSDFNGKNEMERRVHDTCPGAQLDWDGWFYGTYPKATYP